MVCCQSTFSVEQHELESAGFEAQARRGRVHNVFLAAEICAGKTPLFDSATAVAVDILATGDALANGLNRSVYAQYPTPFFFPPTRREV